MQLPGLGSVDIMKAEHAQGQIYSTKKPDDLMQSIAYKTVQIPGAGRLVNSQPKSFAYTAVGGSLAPWMIFVGL